MNRNTLDTVPELVVVELRSGDAGNASDAVCVDCDPGSCTRYEWRALVRPDRLEYLLDHTGAEQIGSPTPWDGRPFGDGNGGTVELVDGQIKGDGLFSPALE